MIGNALFCIGVNKSEWRGGFYMGNSLGNYSCNDFFGFFFNGLILLSLWHFDFCWSMAKVCFSLISLVFVRNIGFYSLAFSLEELLIYCLCPASSPMQPSCVWVALVEEKWYHIGIEVGWWWWSSSKFYNLAIRVYLREVKIMLNSLVSSPYP